MSKAARGPASQRQTDRRSPARGRGAICGHDPIATLRIRRKRLRHQDFKCLQLLCAADGMLLAFYHQRTGMDLPQRPPFTSMVNGHLREAMIDHIGVGVAHKRHGAASRGARQRAG
jgi:hypothetical protein